MKKLEVTKKIGVKANKLAFKMKKNAPEILAVTGAIGVTVSAVMACKATTKLSDILTDTEDQIETIHDAITRDDVIEKGYTEDDMKKDLAIVYVQTGLKIVKLYAPSVILGVFSVGSLLTSNNILRKRNMALALAYTTVDKGFKEYRGRVIEQYGEEVDKSLRFNTIKKKIDTIEIDPETGKEKKVKKEVNVINGDTDCGYARKFDNSSSAWVQNQSYNQMFLKSEQNYANDLLVARGHVFLNEIYDRLGFPRTKAGQIVGWVFNQNNPIGDNYIDFDITEVYDEEIGNYVYMLDFNVDGNVLNLM